MANPKIDPYKLVNPSGSGKKTLASNGPRTNLLAVNRLGKTVNSIGVVVKDLHEISLASIKVDKMREVTERRRLQRERDQRNEDEFERQNALKGKGIGKIKKSQIKKPKESALVSFGKALFGGVQGLLLSAMQFVAGLVNLLAIKGLLTWMSDAGEIKKIAVFLKKLSFVVKKLYGFAKGSVTKILDGFSALVDGNNSFWGRLKGLGTLLLGIVGLQALLNPFGLMDSILRMLNLDFYNPNRRSNTNNKNTSNSNSRVNSRVKDFSKKVKTGNNPIFKKFGKNGERVYRDALKNGLSREQALKRVQRLANKNPSAFKPPPKTSGLSPTTAPKGKILSKGLNRGFGRGALKFLGKNNVKLLSNAFKNTFGRIPIFGSLLTAVFSILNGDSWDKVIFKTLGSAVGGALGTFIPVPGIGSLIGMMGGEYVGELLYIGFRGGGWKAAGQKLKDDMMGLFRQFTKMLSWIKNGWTRFYKGIPKFKIPDFPKDPPKWIPPLGFGLRNKIWTGAKVAMKAMLGPFGMMMGKEIPNVFWMANLTGNTFPLLHKSFFPEAGDAGSGKVETGQKMDGVASDGTDGEGNLAGTSGETTGSEAEGDSRGVPIKNRRGRIIGYKKDGVTTPIGQVNAIQKKNINPFLDYKFTPFVPESEYKGVETDNERYGDTFPEGSFSITPKKKKKEYVSPYERKHGKKHNPLEGIDFGSSYKTKPFVPEEEYKGVESDNERYGDTMPEGAFGIGSKKTDKAKKKRSWWNPFGFETGGKLLRRLPRLNTKQFFFGKIFRGITKAVSGVVKGVTNVVKGVVSSPIGQLLGTVVPIVFPAAAPFIGAVRAIGAAASGDIFGAITGGIGALGGMFPGTFGGVADKFSNFMSNNPFGKALGGFMQGGISGALGGLMGGLGSILPEGVSGMLNKFGGFMKKFPAVGGLIGMIPGVANVPGLSQLFGLDSFGAHGFSPMGLIGNIADSMGFGGLFRTITGMMGGGGAGGLINGLRNMAAELGVKPEVLGIMSQTAKSMSNKKGGMSREYAMQSSLEFIPVPMLLEKLVEIQTPVPIPRMVPVPMPQPAQA